MTVLAEEPVMSIDGHAPEARAAPSTVIFCGGGTGGHLTPGISVARALASMRPNTRVVFLLTGRAAEAPFLGTTPRPSDVQASDGELPHADFERHVVPAVRWPRSLRDLARFPVRWVKVRSHGTRCVRQFAPDAAVGLGGYGQYGPIRAAQRLGLPTILLEQNAVPGKANRMLSRRAGDVCCQWDAGRDHFPARAPVTVTGNPIRQSVLNGSASAAAERHGLHRDRRTLLILGGSQGSRPLNEAMLAALRRSGPALRDSWQVIHQSGPHTGEALEAAYAGLGCPHVVTSFLEEAEMADALAAADLVIARAGATTLAELTATGKPAVLFPLRARDHHQQRNAEVLESAGAARVVADHGDAEKSGEDLARILCALNEDQGTLAAMAQGSRRLGVRDAADRVARLILERVQERRRRQT